MASDAMPAPRVVPPATRASADAAHAAMEREREQIRREYGLVVGDDGHLVKESVK